MGSGKEFRPSPDQPRPLAAIFDGNLLLSRAARTCIHTRRKCDFVGRIVDKLAAAAEYPSKKRRRTLLPALSLNGAASSPVSIQTQSLALASSQSWLPLLRRSIPIDWRLRLLREIFTQQTQAPANRNARSIEAVAINHDWLLANASDCV